LEHQEEFVKVSIIYDDIAISSMNVSINEDKIILFGEDFDLIPHHSRVDMVGYYEDGLSIMSAQVSLSTESQLNLYIVKKDDKQNRRKYIRVKVHKHGKLVKAYAMGKSTKCFRLDEEIETRDVNLGGVGFYSNKILLKRQKITLDFGFLKQGFQPLAEVLRIEKGVSKGGYRYKYGCRFIYKNTEEERLICEYVFKIQIENHTKLKEKGMS